jgi:hypothetical protein
MVINQRINHFRNFQIAWHSAGVFFSKSESSWSGLTIRPLGIRSIELVADCESAGRGGFWAPAASLVFAAFGQHRSCLPRKAYAS